MIRLIMKKIFTISLLAVIMAAFLTSCVKQRTDIDESYWLSKERGTVVYSDPYCEYYIVESINGYSVLRSWGGFKPYEGAVLYGDFSYYGVREFYNRSQGIISSADVIEYWLTYYDAQVAAEYYCY